MRIHAVLGITAALALLPTQNAWAQCLPDSEQAAFEALLTQRLNQSDLPIEDLYRLAQDKLGFGVNPAAALAVPPDSTRAYQIAQLVTQISSSLRGAAGLPSSVDNGLAAIPRARINAELPELPVERYRHAATGMTEAYSELRAANLALAAARTYAESLPPGPARDAAVAEQLRLQRIRGSINNDLYATAPARLMAATTLARNVDLSASLGEFWANHFNIEVRKTSWAAVDYRKALQRAVCSSFRNLLITSAKHPGMQIYLDNFRSRRGAINENYGRELLELHTLGDDLYRYYDQNDVIDTARVLTGWSVQFTELPNGLTQPSFGFFPGAHDGAAVSMFDSAPQGIPLNVAAGQGDTAVSRGERLLGYLASHPATRRNVCAKLARWLIGRTTPEMMSECTSDQVWGPNGNLGAVYRSLLTRRELWTSTAGLSTAEAAALPRLYGAVQKTPIELVASVNRALAVPRSAILTTAWLDAAVNAAGDFGIRPAAVAPPTGYPIGGIWLSSGMTIRFQQYLFGLPTENLPLVQGAVVQRGDAVENRIRNEVATAGARQGPLLAIGQMIRNNALQVPPSFGLSAAAQVGALTDPDARKSDRATAPFRTFVQAYLGSPRFARK